MTKPLVVLLAGLGLGLGTATLSAQQKGSFSVTPSVGLTRFDRTSALSSTKTGLAKLWLIPGLSATYGFGSDFRAGFYLEGGRVEASPDYYPLVLLRSGSTYELDRVMQRVVVLSYGVRAAVALPVVRSIGPYILGGVGGHSVFPDVQRTRQTTNITGVEFSVGGGLSYRTGTSGVVRLEVVDNMWSKWDRDKLNPTEPALQNTVFPEDNPDGITWPKPNLIHNLRLSLGFSFTPSSGGTR